MGIEDDVPLFRRRLTFQPEGVPAVHVIKNLLDLLRRAPEFAAIGEASIIAQVDHVRLQAFKVGAGCGDQFLVRRRGGAGASGGPAGSTERRKGNAVYRRESNSAS